MWCEFKSDSNLNSKEGDRIMRSLDEGQTAYGRRVKHHQDREFTWQEAIKYLLFMIGLLCPIVGLMDNRSWLLMFVFLGLACLWHEITDKYQSSAQK